MSWTGIIDSYRPSDEHGRFVPPFDLREHSGSLLSPERGGLGATTLSAGQNVTARHLVAITFRQLASCLVSYFLCSYPEKVQHLLTDSRPANQLASPARADLGNFLPRKGNCRHRSQGVTQVCEADPCRQWRR